VSFVGRGKKGAQGGVGIKETRKYTRNVKSTHHGDGQTWGPCTQSKSPNQKGKGRRRKVTPGRSAGVLKLRGIRKKERCQSRARATRGALPRKRPRKEITAGGKSRHDEKKKRATRDTAKRQSSSHISAGTTLYHRKKNVHRQRTKGSERSR